MTLTVHSPAQLVQRGTRAVSSRWRSAGTWRWGRYATTSVVAAGVSEGTLLFVYGFHLLAAAWAAVAASLVGVVPSYAMSRYWIWAEADRRRPGRQVAAYWGVALISLGAASLVTGAAAAVAPAGHLVHLVVVGMAYIGTYGGLWVAKFTVYQRFLFRTAPAAPGTGGTALAVERPGASAGRPTT